MSNEPSGKRAEELRRLAAEAAISAGMMVDPNRKRALQALALKDKRLADVVRKAALRSSVTRGALGFGGW